MRNERNEGHEDWCGERKNVIGKVMLFEERERKENKKLVTSSTGNCISEEKE